MTPEQATNLIHAEFVKGNYGEFLSLFLSATGYPTHEGSWLAYNDVQTVPEEYLYVGVVEYRYLSPLSSEIYSALAEYGIYRNGKIELLAD